MGNNNALKDWEAKVPNNRDQRRNQLKKHGF